MLEAARGFSGLPLLTPRGGNELHCEEERGKTGQGEEYICGFQPTEFGASVQGKLFLIIKILET